MRTRLTLAFFMLVLVFAFAELYHGHGTSTHDHACGSTPRATPGHAPDLFVDCPAPTARP